MTSHRHPDYDLDLQLGESVFKSIAGTELAVTAFFARQSNGFQCMLIVPSRNLFPESTSTASAWLWSEDCVDMPPGTGVDLKINASCDSVLPDERSKALSARTGLHIQGVIVRNWKTDRPEDVVTGNAQGDSPRIPGDTSMRPLFKHEPRTEQEVVSLFTAVLPYLERHLLLERVQTPFPDCTAIDEDGRLVRIEFELYGSHFNDHRHPISKCDLMVCWADDWGRWPRGFEVWELHKIVSARCPHLIADVKTVDPSIPWTEDSMLAWAKSEGTSCRDQSMICKIIQFAKDMSLGPQWLTGSRPVFAVRDADQYFKVDGHGRIGFPFSRLSVEEALFAELIARLNGALGEGCFSQGDARRKGIGWILSERFNADKDLDRFLKIWGWFKNRTNAQSEHPDQPLGG
jgi:hypothetical protein